MRPSRPASLLALVATLASSPSARADPPPPVDPPPPPLSSQFASFPTFVAGWGLIGGGAIHVGVGIKLASSGSPTETHPSTLQDFGVGLAVSGAVLIGLGAVLVYFGGRSPHTLVRILDVSPGARAYAGGGPLRWSF